MNLWGQLKEHTQARIGLQRSGHSLSTNDWLDFQLAHALARDAVQEVWEVAQFEEKLIAAGEKPIHVKTAVSIREQYLKFPTLGRILTSDSRAKVSKYSQRHQTDIVFIITDGLSVPAINAHAIPFWKVLKPMLQAILPDFKYTIVLAPYGRVALSDDIGETLGAKLSVILVGERPGLTSVNSLGIYLTYHPKAGHSDAERNCISNVHPPEGLSYAIAAEKLLFLITESLRLKLSGIHLKESPSQQLADKLPARRGLGM